MPYIAGRKNKRCNLNRPEWAMEFSAAGKLEEWVHAYLLSDGHNKDFSDGLKMFNRYFVGPLKMPLDLFTRCCGPEADMRYRVDSNWFETHVTELMDVVQHEPDMPPLIVHYVDDGFELNDGNHRHEAYARLGIQEYYVIVWITEKDEYNTFVKKYGNHGI